MLLPVLAGLGALSLMSNPRRRRRGRTTRRNPEFQFAVEHAKTGRQRVSPWFPSREEGERWLARLNRDDGAGTWRRLGRATRRGRMGGGRLDREIHGESLNLRAAASYGNRAEMDEAQGRLDRLRKARRMMARRTNPGPTAKDIRLLVLLQNELALAENRYEMRTHRSDARKLRREAVEARLRYRRFFRGMEAKTRSNPGRPVAKPTTERRAYQLGYAEGRDITGDLGRRGGWPATEDIQPGRAKGRLEIAWLRGNDAGLAAARRSRSNPRRRGRRNPLDADTIRRVHTRYYVLTNDLYHSQVKDADLAAYIAKAADRWASAHRASDRRVAPYLRELVAELTKTNPRRAKRRRK